MDTLAMHRTLTEANLTKEQADAIIKVMQGGVATKQDLDLFELRLAGRIKRLENKVNLILGGVVLAVIAPAVARLVVG